MFKRTALVIGLFGACLFMTGCPREVKLEDAEVLNFGIDHWSWRLTEKSTAPETCKDMSRVHELRGLLPLRPPCGNTQGTCLSLRPGMKLTVSYSDIVKQSKNIKTPGLASYAYIVPTGKLNDVDYFFLGYLISSGKAKREKPFETGGALDEYRALGGQIDDDGFRRKLEETVLARMLRSMVLLPKTQGEMNPCSFGTAAEVRERLSEPTKQDFENPTLHRQELQVTMPTTSGDARISLFDWSPGYFNDSIESTTPGAMNNPFYSSQASGISYSRASLSVEIPVRLSDERTSQYYPVYFSFADLQNRLGVAIIAVRRKYTYLQSICKDEILKNQKLTMKHCEQLKGPDGYFTMWFHEGNNSFGAKRYLRVDSGKMNNLLLAPGDIVYLFKESRLAPTDSPEIR